MAVSSCTSLIYQPARWNRSPLRLELQLRKLSPQSISMAAVSHSISQEFFPSPSAMMTFATTVRSISQPLRRGRLALRVLLMRQRTETNRTRHSSRPAVSQVFAAARWRHWERLQLPLMVDPQRSFMRPRMRSCLLCLVSYRLDQQSFLSPTATASHPKRRRTYPRQLRVCSQSLVMVAARRSFLIPTR